MYRLPRLGLVWLLLVTAAAAAPPGTASGSSFHARTWISFTVPDHLVDLRWASRQQRGDFLVHDQHLSRNLQGFVRVRKAANGRVWFAYSGCPVTRRGAFRLNICSGPTYPDYEVNSGLADVSLLSKTLVDMQGSDRGTYQFPIQRSKNYYYHFEIPGKTGCRSWNAGFDRGLTSYRRPGYRLSPKGHVFLASPDKLIEIPYGEYEEGAEYGRHHFSSNDWGFVIPDNAPNPFPYDFWFRYENCPLTSRGAFRITLYAAPDLLLDDPQPREMRLVSKVFVDSRRSDLETLQLQATPGWLYSIHVEVPSKKGCGLWTGGGGGFLRRLPHCPQHGLHEKGANVAGSKTAGGQPARAAKSALTVGRRPRYTWQKRAGGSRSYYFMGLLRSITPRGLGP